MRNRRKNRRLQTGSFFLLPLFLSVEMVAAAEYSLESSLTAAGHYRDNYRLAYAAEEKLELAGGEVIYDGSLRRRTQTANQALLINVNEKNFDDESYNRTNGSLAIRANYAGPRTSLSFLASARRDSVRANEQEVNGSGAIRDFESSRAESQNVTLQNTWTISERTSLTASASGQHQSYESSAYRGYDYFQAGLNWTTALFQNFSLQAVVDATRLDSDPGEQVTTNPNLFDAANGVEAAQCAFFAQSFTDASGSFSCFKLLNLDNTQETLAVRLGFIWAISERFSLDLQVGQTRSETDRRFSYEPVPGSTVLDPVASESQQFDNSSLSYQLELGYDFGKHTLTFEASAAETATSQGTLRENNRFEIRDDLQLSETLTMTFAAIFIDQNALGGDDVLFSERESILGRFVVTKKISEDWSVTLRQSYQRQKRDEISDDAENNSTLLSIRWETPSSVWRGI